LARWQLKISALKSHPRSDADPLYDRHGFDHRDTQRPYAVTWKVHNIARQRRGRLGKNTLSQPFSSGSIR